MHENRTCSLSITYGSYDRVNLKYDLWPRIIWTRTLQDEQNWHETSITRIALVLIVYRWIAEAANLCIVEHQLGIHQPVVWWITAGCLLAKGIWRHLKTTRAPMDVWQALETSPSKSSQGKFQHQYLPELLVDVYSYHLMVNSVSCCCVCVRRLFSNAVTYVTENYSTALQFTIVLYIHRQHNTTDKHNITRETGRAECTSSSATWSMTYTAQ